MIHIKLGPRRPVDQPDPLDRSWVGYDGRVPNDELFEINRGTWKLGSRAARERYAVFSYTGDHKVKFVASIERIEPSDWGRKILVGHVLPGDHPIAQRWVDAGAPDLHRNPVTYFQESDAEAQTCACGCGEEVSGQRAFLPGHDQKAIHMRITEGWGDTLRFIEWYDANRGELPSAN